MLRRVDNAVPRGQFWYAFVALTKRGRAVLFVLALICQAIMVRTDYQVHDILLAALETIPVLVVAIGAGYPPAVAFAAVTAVFSGMYETEPEPQPLTNPDVVVNASIILVGYLIALGLLRGIASLLKRLRRLLEDFEDLKAAHDELLPDRLPLAGDWEFSVLNVPRNDVAGLFYDVIAWKGGIDLFACSVSGPPVRAAMTLPAIKGLWHETGALPPTALRTLDERLTAMLKRSVPIRAWHGKLYDNGIVRYASAGSPAPFLVGPDGTMRRLAGGGGLLGACGAPVAEAMYMLDAGAALILGNEGFCRLVDEGILQPGDVLRDLDGVQAQLSGSAKADDVLAIVARRRANALSRYLDPALSSDDTVQ